jgi:hypothetical protein
MDRAGIVHEARTFSGVDHAFFNDTAPRAATARRSSAAERGSWCSWTRWVLALEGEHVARRARAPTLTGPQSWVRLGDPFELVALVFGRSGPV